MLTNSPRQSLGISVVALVLAVALGDTRPVHAALIATEWLFVSNPDVVQARFSGLNVGNANNDDAGQNQSNTGTVTKDYFGLGVVDAVIRVTNSATTGIGVTALVATEYLFTEDVANDTSVPWTGYRFQLGFGTGVNFVPSNALDELDFDCPLPSATPPTSTDFASVAHGCDTIVWNKGNVPPDLSSRFTFALDVPDVSSEIPPFARTADGYIFTLRQFPTVAVPGPPNILLLVVGAALIGWRLRPRVVK